MNAIISGSVKRKNIIFPKALNENRMMKVKNNFVRFWYSKQIIWSYISFKTNTFWIEKSCRLSGFIILTLRCLIENFFVCRFDAEHSSQDFF